MVPFEIISDIVINLRDFGDVVLFGFGVVEVFVEFGPALKNYYQRLGGSIRGIIKRSTSLSGFRLGFMAPGTSSRTIVTVRFPQAC